MQRLFKAIIETQLTTPTSGMVQFAVRVSSQDEVRVGDLFTEICKYEQVDDNDPGRIALISSTALTVIKVKTYGRSFDSLSSDTDAYGNTIIFTAPGSGGWFDNTSTQGDQPTCEYIFTGRQYDPETQLYFYRRRYYNPQLGRFINRDPINYAGGMNLYEYVGSRCVVQLDPQGLDALQTASDFAAGVGDSLSMGLTSWIRGQLGVDDAVNYNSGAYLGGEITEFAVETGVTLGGAALRKRAAEFAGKEARYLLEGSARQWFRKATGAIGGFIHHWNPIRESRFPLAFKWAARGFWNMVHVTEEGHAFEHAWLRLLDKADVIRTVTSPIRSGANALYQHLIKNSPATMPATMPTTRSATVLDMTPTGLPSTRPTKDPNAPFIFRLTMSGTQVDPPGGDFNVQIVDSKEQINPPGPNDDGWWTHSIGYGNTIYYWNVKNGHIMTNAEFDRMVAERRQKQSKGKGN